MLTFKRKDSVETMDLEGIQQHENEREDTDAAQLATFTYADDGAPSSRTVVFVTAETASEIEENNYHQQHHENNETDMDYSETTDESVSEINVDVAATAYNNDESDASSANHALRPINVKIQQVGQVLEHSLRKYFMYD